MATTLALLTVEDFLNLPEDDPRVRRELIEGEVIEMERGEFRHEKVKSNFTKLLAAYLVQQPVGDIFPETGFTMENSVVIPDVAISGPDHQRTSDPSKVPQGAPLLTVEVVSSETAETLERKVKLYLRNGCKIVIVAYPLGRSIRVHDASRIAKDLEQDQFLELPDLLPGFRVQVAKFFEGI